MCTRLQSDGLPPSTLSRFPYLLRRWREIAPFLCPAQDFSIGHNRSNPSPR